MSESTDPSESCTYHCDAAKEEIQGSKVDVLNCNDGGTAQSQSYGKLVCKVLSDLGEDLCRVQDRVSYLMKLVEVLQKAKYENNQISCSMKEDVKKIECELTELLGLHRNMEQSVETTKDDVERIRDRLVAMQAQIDELANITTPNEDVVNENNVALEMPIRTKSEPIVSKDDWDISGRNDIKTVIDSLRSELKNLREEIGVSYSDRSLLKELREFLEEELEKGKQRRMLRIASVDSGVGSIKQTVVNPQLDTPSSDGSSLQLSISRQQSNLSNSSQITSEITLESPLSGQNKGSAVQFSLGSPHDSHALPLSSGYSTTPPVRASTDPAAGSLVLHSGPNDSFAAATPSCGCRCDERIDSIIQSLHKIVKDHLP